MKVDRLETHDRMLEAGNQWEEIEKGCLECISNVPDSIKFPFYIYAHTRTIENDERCDLVRDHGYQINKAPSIRMIWTPRITKPKVETNSYLFMARKGSDEIRTIWMLPKAEVFKNFAPGQMTANEDIWTCIQNYKYRRAEMQKPEKDGPTKNNEIEWGQIFAHEAAKKRKKKPDDFKLVI